MARAQLGPAPSSTKDAARYGDLTPHSEWSPEDVGFIAWAYDPVAIIGNALPTAGTLQMVRLKVPRAQTITNVVLSVVTQGSTLTSGRNFAALFNSSLALLAATADQTTAWGTAGMKVAALSVAQAVAAGDYFVGFYANGTTVPAFGRGNANVVVNGSLATASSRFATSSTGLTTAMPNPAAALAANTNSFWAAVS
jgi:hypothetical protein